jgi:hypothetical protein
MNVDAHDAWQYSNNSSVAFRGWFTVVFEGLPNCHLVHSLKARISLKGLVTSTLKGGDEYLLHIYLENSNMTESRLNGYQIQ